MADYKCIIAPGPTFEPYATVASAITNAAIPTVTTTFDHNYVDGTIVRFTIPPACGMIQLDQQTSPILVTGSNTFTIAIDTLKFDIFVVPVGLGPHVNICANVVPMAEINSTLKAAVVNVL